MPAIPIGGPVSPSITPSVSRGSSPSVTPTVTPSVSISRTPFASPSVTPTRTPSKTPTPTPTPSITPSMKCQVENYLEIAQAAALQYFRITVDYHKLNLTQTKRNIYGESLEKWYFEPISVRCHIDRSPDTQASEMFGPDTNRELKLSIPKLEWDSGSINLIQGVNILPEIGDIIRDLATDRYFEVNNIITNYTPTFNTFNITQLAQCPNKDLIVYELTCHQTRVSRLNLSPNKLL